MCSAFTKNLITSSYTLPKNCIFVFSTITSTNSKMMPDAVIQLQQPSYDRFQQQTTTNISSYYSKTFFNDTMFRSNNEDETNDFDNLLSDVVSCDTNSRTVQSTSSNLSNTVKTEQQASPYNTNENRPDSSIFTSRATGGTFDRTQSFVSDTSNDVNSLTSLLINSKSSTSAPNSGNSSIGGGISGGGGNGFVSRKLHCPQGGTLHALCANDVMTWAQKLERLESILAEDPTSSGRDVVIYSKFHQRPVYGFSPKSHKYELQPQTTYKLLPLDYRYALNLAITNTTFSPAEENVATAERNKCDFLVRLILEDGRVLTKLDGPASCKSCSLHLLLKYMPQSVEVLDAMLLNNTECIQQVDSLGNTPFHILAQYATPDPACVEVAHHLYLFDSSILSKPNKYGITAVQMAQRRSTCPEAIADFLSQKVEEIS